MDDDVVKGSLNDSECYVDDAHELHAWLKKKKGGRATSTVIKHVTTTSLPRRSKNYVINLLAWMAFHGLAEYEEKKWRAL